MKVSIKAILDFLAQVFYRDQRAFVTLMAKRSDPERCKFLDGLRLASNVHSYEFDDSEVLLTVDITDMVTTGKPATNIISPKPTKVAKSAKPTRKSKKRSYPAPEQKPTTLKQELERPIAPKSKETNFRHAFACIAKLIAPETGMKVVAHAGGAHNNVFDLSWKDTPELVSRIMVLGRVSGNSSGIAFNRCSIKKAMKHNVDTYVMADTKNEACFLIKASVLHGWVSATQPNKRSFITVPCSVWRQWQAHSATASRIKDHQLLAVT
jgi:hypothetical protein